MSRSLAAHRIDRVRAAAIGSVGDLSSAEGQYCFQYMASNKLSLAAGTISGAFSYNPDFADFQVGFNTKWTPVKNLTFTGEEQYVHLDQNFTGAATLTPSAPTAVNNVRV
jgi:hypothetical protein